MEITLKGKISGGNLYIPKDQTGAEYQSAHDLYSFSIMVEKDSEEMDNFLEDVKKAIHKSVVKGKKLTSAQKSEAWKGFIEHKWQDGDEIADSKPDKNYEFLRGHYIVWANSHKLPPATGEWYDLSKPPIMEKKRKGTQGKINKSDEVTTILEVYVNKQKYTVSLKGVAVYLHKKGTFVESVTTEEEKHDAAFRVLGFDVEHKKPEKETEHSEPEGNTEPEGDSFEEPEEKPKKKVEKKVKKEKFPW